MKIKDILQFRTTKIRNFVHNLESANDDQNKKIFNKNNKIFFSNQKIQRDKKKKINKNDDFYNKNSAHFYKTEYSSKFKNIFPHSPKSDIAKKLNFDNDNLSFNRPKDNNIINNKPPWIPVSRKNK